jgi:hypothetical protein
MKARTPTDDFGRCPLCFLMPAECHCAWEVFCADHRCSFAQCWENNFRCRPGKKEVPEPQIDDPEPEPPVKPETNDLEDIIPGVRWRREHPSVPWRTGTHHGEFQLEPDGVWHTVGFPNPGTERMAPRIKRAPSLGSFKSDYLEELKETVAEKCGSLYDKDILDAQLHQEKNPRRIGSKDPRQGRAPQKFFKGKMLGRHVHMPCDLWFRLQEIAAENERPVSFEVEHALAMYVKGYGAKKRALEPEPMVTEAVTKM